MGAESGDSHIILLHDILVDLADALVLREIHLMTNNGHDHIVHRKFSLVLLRNLDELEHLLLTDHFSLDAVVELSLFTLLLLFIILSLLFILLLSIVVSFLFFDDLFDFLRALGHDQVADEHLSTVLPESLTDSPVPHVALISVYVDEASVTRDRREATLEVVPVALQGQQDRLLETISPV